MTEWNTNFDEVVNFIKEATRQDIWTESGDLKEGALDWSWALNTKCKYVELRIDMRDGAFLISDKDGKLISFDDLKWQYKSEPK